jgi:peptidoglycan/xylan/chitin deacetylase (PgdA/CDA1 family)
LPRENLYLSQKIMAHKPLASLSLDLDNLWTYLKTHGDPGWESFPSYLHLVVPRFLELFRNLDLKLTVFVVGQDAVFESNHSVLRSISDAGHEIGNHSFHHEPWLHLYSAEEIEHELIRAEQAIVEATGQHPRGFRGPGFSHSETLLRLLGERQYSYDGSSLPTFLGPLARTYYFLTARLSAAERERRKQLFGTFSEGFKPLRPYEIHCGDVKLWEIPVTVMPLLRTPIHLSYILYLGSFSKTLALSYLRASLWLCRVFRIAPSFLLHPLDFVSGEDAPSLKFFPAMSMPLDKKMALAEQVLSILRQHFQVLPMGEFCTRLMPAPLQGRHAIVRGVEVHSSLDQR